MVHPAKNPVRELHLLGFLDPGSLLCRVSCLVGCADNRA